MWTLWQRLVCVLRHGGTHVWMLPIWGLDGAVLRCGECGHVHVVRYEHAGGR